MSWLEQWLCLQCQKHIVGTLQVVLQLAREHVCPPTGESASTNATFITTSEMPGWSVDISNTFDGAALEAEDIVESVMSLMRGGEKR